VKIKFVCQLQNYGYSGGRYYAIMLAAGMSRDHEVHFYTNSPNSQIFRECFSFSNIKFMKYDQYRNDNQYDISIVFPGGEADFNLHRNLLTISKFNCKKSILFSFETENWWNSFSIETKTSNIWLPWKEMSEQVDGILCVSKECVSWARDYYEKDAQFPMMGIDGPINSFICDQIQAERKKQVCFFTRIGRNSSHKGFRFLKHLDRKSLSGYTVKVIFGGDKPNKVIENSFKRLFQKNNIDLLFLNDLKEEEKFKIIKESRFLFYPEEFTGFGLPPLESLYCGTIPICFDIPVLRKNDIGLFRWMSRETIGEDIDNLVQRGKFTSQEEKKLSLFKKDIELYNCSNRIIESLRRF
jgi:hypothetical protein